MDYKQVTSLSQSLKQSDSPAVNYSGIELHVPDFEKTKEFYLALGFKLVWERIPEGFNGYLVMKLENNILCFWGGNEEIYDHPYFSKFEKSTVKGFGVEVVLQVADLEKYYEKAEKLGCVYEKIQTRHWGIKDFRVIDPWGFYLRVSDFHNILSDENAVI